MLILGHDLVWLAWIISFDMVMVKLEKAAKCRDQGGTYLHMAAHVSSMGKLGTIGTWEVKPGAPHCTLILNVNISFT